MKKFITGASALLFSLTASADWSYNSHDVPIVTEQSNENKIMAFYACPNGGEPQIILADGGLPDSALGKVMEFRARIDRNPNIYDISATVVEISSDINGLSMVIRADPLTELIEGNFIRFQFPLENNDNIVEVYSLKGFTRIFMQEARECSEPDEDLDSYFDDESNTDDEYFL